MGWISSAIIADENGATRTSGKSLSVTSVQCVGRPSCNASTHKPPRPRYSSPVVAESLHTDWKQLLHLLPMWTQMRERLSACPNLFHVFFAQILRFVLSGLQLANTTLATCSGHWRSPPSSMISQEDPSLGRRASGQTEVLVRNSARLGADWILDGIL